MRIPLESSFYVEDGNGNRVKKCNFDAHNITTERYKKFIELHLAAAHQAMPKPPQLTWGAPGIGKTAITKSVVQKWNDSHPNSEDKLGLIIIDCSYLSQDSFSTKKLRDVIEKMRYAESMNEPSSCFQIYYPTSSNGLKQPCYGGMLLFRNFLCADIAILQRIRSLTETFTLGEKWSIMCCTSRPLDNEEVLHTDQHLTSWFYRRFALYNYVPTFTCWVKWALDNGFDETTLAFIAGEDVYGENSRWFNMDPEEMKRTGQTQFANLKNWSDFIADLSETAKSIEKSTGKQIHYYDIPKEKFLNLGEKYLPAQLVEEYADYYYKYAPQAINLSEIFDKVIKSPDQNLRELGFEEMSVKKAIQALFAVIRMRYAIPDCVCERKVKEMEETIPVEVFYNCQSSLVKTYSQETKEIYNSFYLNMYNEFDLYDIQEKCKEKGKEFPYAKVDEYWPKSFRIKSKVSNIINKFR